MNAQEIEEIKEYGRRQVFRVRFPKIYGKGSGGFVVRTLLRGEIFRAFAKAGYPEREIPKSKPYARTKVENDLFPICVMDVPEGFTLFRAHAFVVTTIVNESLRRSGFIEGSDEHTEVLQRGLRYANSVEGRMDAIILRTFPSIRPYDLEQMTYDECTMRCMQAILLDRNLAELLRPDPEVLRTLDTSADVEDEVIAAPVPLAKTTAPAKPTPKQGQTEAKKTNLLRQLGLPPNISAQSIGLNQQGNPDTVIEKGETRMFVAGEKYDVDKLRSKIRQDAGE